MAQPIGSWQEHLPFQQAIAVGSTGSGITAASPYALFQYNPESEEINRLTKVNGLTDAGIQTIRVAEQATIIAYQNSQLDIVQSNRIRSVNTIRFSSINADKRIYQIWLSGNTCLLATGFGIAVLDLNKAEIGDIYLPANNGAFSRINQIAADANFFYAAGINGLQRAPRTGVNLADFRNWETLSGNNGLPASDAEATFTWMGSLFVQQQNKLYRQNENEFTLWYEDEWTWNSIDTSANSLLISQVNASAARVLELSSTASIQQTLSNPLIQQPAQAIFSQNTYWIADIQSGLLAIQGNSVDRIIPNSPAGIGTGGLTTGAAAWWMATATGLNRFAEGNWELFPFQDIDPVLISRTNEIWVGSTIDGLAKFENGIFTVYKEPLLEPAVAAPQAYKVGGLALDPSNNLWITNDGAARGLVVRYADGSHESFEIPFFYPSLGVRDILLDDLNQKWILSPGNGLFCFADGQWQYYQAGQGNGNLPTNNVLSMVKDQFGFIWVGTDDGIGIIQCPESVFTAQRCEAVLPVVQTDNFAGYLFKGESVQAMAVDGANRKWIGTKNGVWLISASGDQTLLRFTSSNSPLPDNDIRRIAIDAQKGTVLLSTAKGLVAYQSAATEGGTASANVLVYPNPVAPGYTGPIAIRGLVNNANIKITELNGRLVYQGRALGGQAIWNGLDLNGRRAATGVYLVLISDDTRKEQAVAKIVFIQQ